MNLSFATVQDAVYVVQYKVRLDDPDWLEMWRQTGTGAPLVITNNPATPTCFYRVQVE